MRCFLGHCERYKNSWLVKVYPCPFAHCPIIFAPSNWHCVISWWCLHVGKHCHYGPQSSWFGFTCYFFSWGWCDNHNLGEGRFWLWSIFNRHVYFNYRGFRLFTPASKGFFHQNMVWGMKGIENPPFSILHAFLETEGLSDVTTCVNNLYFETYN